MKKGVLVRLERDPLAGYTKESFVSALLLNLNNRVEGAYIFGSFFSDKFSRDSDVDLILVKETDVPFVKRGEEFFDLLDLGPTMDILVYTPEEFKKLISEENPGFWKSVRESMKKIL